MFKTRTPLFATPIDCLRSLRACLVGIPVAPFNLLDRAIGSARNTLLPSVTVRTNRELLKRQLLPASRTSPESRLGLCRLSIPRVIRVPLIDLVPVFIDILAVGLLPALSAIRTPIGVSGRGELRNKLGNRFDLVAKSAFFLGNSLLHNTFNVSRAQTRCNECLTYAASAKKRGCIVTTLLPNFLAGLSPLALRPATSDCSRTTDSGLLRPNCTGVGISATLSWFIFP